MAKELIIGLGGTGIRIVNLVSGKIAKKEKNAKEKKYYFAAVDTSSSDIQRFKNANDDSACLGVFKDKSVKECINKYKEDGIDEWLPNPSTLTDVKMYEFGGQVRLVSRLALYDCIKDEAMDDLSRQLDKIIYSLESKRVNVTIVSSIAGGAGSGMLIQIAMWVRKYFEKEGVSSSITGMLILPELYIQAIKQIGCDEIQRRALRANAYATMKELNAINKATINGYKPSKPIKLDEVGYNSDSDDKAPLFDNTFIMDYTLGNRAKDTSIVDYEEMVARAVCNRVYGTMADDIKSEEDNLLRFFSQSKEPLYNSCGTSKAVYPYESVLEYCTLKASKESLLSGWSLIDKHIAKLEKSGEKTDYSYLEAFDELSKTKNPQSNLLYNIRNDIMNETIGLEGGKERLYLSGKICDFMWELKHGLMDEIERKNIGNLSDIKIREEAHKWIKETEELSTIWDLKDFVLYKRRKVEAFVSDLERVAPSLALTIADRICPVNMGEIDEGNKLSILGLFTKKDEDGKKYFVHPIAIRYLLYKLLNKLNEMTEGEQWLEHIKRKITCNPQTQKYEEEIRAFDKLETFDEMEDAYTYLDKKPFFKTEGKFIKEYKLVYYEYNRELARNCEEYANEFLSNEIAKILIDRVKTLIKTVEELFGSFDVMCGNFERKMENNVKMCKSTGSVINVYASSEEKEHIYSSLNLKVDNTDIAFNEKIAKALYGSFCAKENPDAFENRSYIGLNVASIFEKELVECYGEIISSDYNDEIDLDIYEALCQSLKFKKSKDTQGEETDDIFDFERRYEIRIEQEKAFKDVIKELIKDGAPSISLNDDENKDVIYMRYWGFNPKLAKSCWALSDIIGVNVDSNADEAYPKNEITCYQSVYGIPAYEISAFDETNEDDGESYYQSYKSVVDKMVKAVDKGDNDALIQTPHLDKTWHETLPFISPKMNKPE